MLKVDHFIAQKSISRSFLIAHRKNGPFLVALCRNANKSTFLKWTQVGASILSTSATPPEFCRVWRPCWCLSIK